MGKFKQHLKKYKGAIKIKTIEFKNAEQLVETILTNYPFTRNSDDLLNAMIIQYLGYGECNYIDIMKNRKKYGIPSFATIERCRRKLQATREDLQATDKVASERFELQNDYESYALDKMLL